MANYYVDKNGDITLGKKKKKFEDNDIAPVKTTTNSTTKSASNKENENTSWFKSGAFADGYDFGDITKTILGTGGDIVGDALAGVLGMGEKIVDMGAYNFQLAAEENRDTLGLALGKSGFTPLDREKTAEFIKKDLYDEEKLANNIAKWTTPLGWASMLLGVDVEDDSVLGTKSEGIVQSGGQLAATAGLQSVGVPWFLTTGVTAFGSESENALKEGAEFEEAGMSALTTAAAEMITEKMFGGIKFAGKAVGAFDDVVSKVVLPNVKSVVGQAVKKIGISAAGEGIEEVTSDVISKLGQWLTYQDDKTFQEMFLSKESFEEYFDSFLGGAILGGVSGGVDVTKNAVNGRAAITGLTKNEDAVVRKIYEAELAEAEKNGKKVNKNKLWDSIVKQMDDGEISIDTIEEVLGGDDYTAYRDTIDKETSELKEITESFEGSKEELQKFTDDYLAKSARKDLKSKLRESVFNQVDGSRLTNSYVESELRKKAFEADVNQYKDENARKTIQNIIDSGSANNTRRVHKLADMMAKISADKKIVFSITDAKKLAETSMGIDGKIIDGFVTENGDITINLDSPKYLNRVVGHEVTHVLEGTEFYNEFQNIIVEYAKAKGEYNGRITDAVKRYNNVKGYEGNNVAIKKEVIADLVGDYIFSDPEFIKNLSVNHRNIFEKIYDEIKYLCKVATAGSKEARDLERVKKAFEDAYRAEGVKKTDGKTGTQYSLYLSKEDIPDYLKAGNRQNKNRQKRYDEGKQVVLSTDEEFASFVEKSIKGSHNEMVAYGKVEDGLARQVKEKSNSIIDISESYLELLSEDVRHAYGEHYQAKEAGDLDMSVGDLIFALKNVNDGEVVSAKQYKDGGQRVTLAIKTNDGVMMLVELASKSAGSLRLKTGWKLTTEKFDKKYGSNMSTTGSKNPTNAAHDDIASNGSIAQNGKNVNTQFSFSEETDNDKAPVKQSATEISGADVRLQTTEDVAPIADSVANAETPTATVSNVEQVESVAPVQVPNNTNAVAIEKHGQFYEIRGEMAKRVSKDLDLKVFYREINGEKVPAVGFPLRFLDTYNKKANINGYSLVQNPLPDNLAPTSEQMANQQQTENISTITDADAPAEVESSAPEQTTDVSTPRNPFEQRDYTKVGSTKTKSFVEENPDAQSFFQEAAQAMLGDLRNSQKGQRWYNDRLYYESGGENGLGGVQRETTQDIADLLDGQYHYSYQQIDDALNFIIHGEKLNACAKRIEFALNDRLMNGYTDVYGNNIPPNQDYINLLNQMQTAEDVNRQGSGAVFTDADVPVTDIVPSKATAPKVKAPVTEDVAPSKVTETEAEEEVAQIGREDPKAKEGSFWSRAKKTINDAITLIGDKGWAIENLAKKTKNRTIEALYDFYRNRTKGVAQEYIHDRLLPMWEKIEKTGKLEDFQLYAYHLHNIDRMSLDTPEGIARRKELRKVLEGYNERQIETIASKKITRNTKPDMVATIYAAQEYINLGGERGLNKAVFGDSVTAEDSRKAVAEYEANNPEFKGWEQEVLEYNKALREYAVQEGLISRKTANLWAKMYPHYVPISRHGKNGLSVNVPLDTRRTGVDSPFKRAKGGNSDFDPLFETMAKNTEQIFRAVQRNRFGIELMDTLEASYMMDAEKSSDKATRQAVLEGKIPAGTRVKAFDRNNIGTINSYNPKTGEYNVHFDGEHGSADANIDARLIAPLGKLRQTIAQNEDADADSILDSTDENESDGMVVEEGKNGMPASFTVFVKGKRVKFDISEEIYNAVKPVTGELANTYALPNKLADGYKKLLTQYNPVFSLWRNPIKDAKDVLLNSQHAGKTYLNVAEAFVNLTKGGKWIEEYVKNGGNSVTYYDSKKKIFKKQNKILDKLNVYGKATEKIETLWRLAEYIASRKEGRSVEVSMLDAARVTTNFGAGGDLTKWANRNGAMFLNPSVQGTMQIGRNIREAHHQGVKGYAILAGKVIAMGLPSLVANWLFWDDDEEYQELSDYVKMNYFIIGKTDDGKFIRIPKGRAEAVIQYAFEKTEDLLTGDEDLNMETFGEIAANGFDLVVSNLAPNNPLENNLISPIKQVAENKTWYGEDLVPTRLQDLPANEQYDETTDEISKWFANTGVGKLFNVSPYKMNYLMQQYGGGLADTVLPMLTPEAESGSDSLMGNLIAPWKDEFVSDGVLKNQNVSDFYDLKDKLTVNANASTATDEDYLKSSYMNAINSELSELYAKKREIQNSTFLTDEEKYQEVRAIQQEIVALTREALNSYEDVNIQGNYATVGDVQYRYYTPDEDSTAEPGWRKLSTDQIRQQDRAINKLGITASEYWSNKEEYDYAVEKPEKYAVANAVGGYKVFRNVSKDLYDIKADKDSSGKSISGSRKNKVLDYINGLDLDYGEKIILFKSEYNADDTYNMEIVNYLNSRTDISYEEMETILKELGFTVHPDGRVTW